MPRPITTLRLAPEVPGLEALGASSPDDFLAALGEAGSRAPGAERLVTGDRIEALGGAGPEAVARIPLPGTPDREGVQRETPRGAGTGMLILRVWRGGRAERVKARVTNPKSTSLAARRWNMICHLTSNGLGAPALVAMGEGSGSSFLLERELDGFESLAQLATRELRPRRRRLILRSIGMSLGSLLRSGAWLPELKADNLLVQRDAMDGSHEGPDTCAALEVQDLQAEREALRSLALRRTRLPGVAFDGFAGARLFDKPVSPRLYVPRLGALAAALPITPLERDRVAVLVQRRVFGPA